jgi:uncharacterized membrane protein YfcA
MVTAGQWAILAVAALIVGLSKTSISGFGSLVVAMFALVLPAKESTASSLLLLVVGDMLAVGMYRTQADWKLIRHLLPAVVPGVLLGWLFIGRISDKVMLFSIGACLLVAVFLQIGLRWHASRTGAASAAADNGGVGADAPVPLALTVASGMAAGFVTLVANAASAVMSLYLLLVRADKVRFVATGAWFYFIVNLIKVPFVLQLGLVRREHLVIFATLIPLLVVGALVGRRFLRRLRQGSFEWIVLAVSAVSALVLFLRGLLM